MALPTNIYTDVSTYFPGIVEAGSGTNVTKSGNIWTVSLNLSTVPVNSIGIDKLETISQGELLARHSAATGSVEKVTLNNTLELSGTTLQRAAITGAVSVPAGSNVSVLNPGSITLASLESIASDRILGRDAAGSGAIEQLTVDGGLEFTGAGGIQSSAYTGDVTKSAGGSTLTIPDETVTYAKMQHVSATDRLIGRDTAGAGDPEELTVGGGVEFTGSGGIQSSAYTGDVTKAAGGTALTIANEAIDHSHLNDDVISGATTSGSFTTGDKLLMWRSGTGMRQIDYSQLPAGGGSASLPRGHLAGMQLSRNAVTTVGVAAGECRDSTDATDMALATGYVKTFAAWAVGTGNGGLDTGSIAANTWYHVHVIERTDTGVTDVLLSTSATSPTMPTNYDRRRRIGSIRTDGSSQLHTFTQEGDLFVWGAAKTDYASLFSTSAVFVTLSTPPGVRCLALIGGQVQSSAQQALYISSADGSDKAPTLGGIGNLILEANTYNSFQLTIITNTSSQIRGRSTSTANVDIMTEGYVDFRGKFD